MFINLLNHILIFTCAYVWFVCISSFSQYFFGYRNSLSYECFAVWLEKISLTQTKIYQCHVCGRTFLKNCDLLSHNKSHTDSKPYQCNICDSVFSRKWDLSGQIKIHTNNKQFQCDICDTAFLRKWDLLRHIKTHSVINTGDKPFQCNYCEKAF